MDSQRKERAKFEKSAKDPKIAAKTVYRGSWLAKREVC